MRKSRALPALLVGLGIALIVGGLLAPRALLIDARFPLSLTNTTWTMADPDGVRDGRRAPVVRQLHMEVRNPSDGDTVNVRVGDSLRAGTSGADFDNLVSASTWAFAFDRVTGEVPQPASAQLVMAMPAAEVPVEGVWLKFPVDVEQRSYDVFDPVLRGAAPAEFVGEDELEGRSVYRFRQRIAPTNLAQRFADERNTTYVEGPGGEPVRAFLFHSAERVLTVDQVSGLVVGIDEQVDDYYGDAQGRGIRNVVTYDARADEAQVRALLGELAGVEPESRGRSISWTVATAGALLALVGLALAAVRRRSRGPRSPRHAR